jgi:hypothetical protein
MSCLIALNKKEQTENPFGLPEGEPVGTGFGPMAFVGYGGLQPPSL